MLCGLWFRGLCFAASCLGLLGNYPVYSKATARVAVLSVLRCTGCHPQALKPKSGLITHKEDTASPRQSSGDRNRTDGECSGQWCLDSECSEVTDSASPLGIKGFGESPRGGGAVSSRALESANNNMNNNNSNDSNNNDSNNSIVRTIFIPAPCDHVGCSCLRTA